jgi:hypothetical protein
MMGKESPRAGLRTCSPIPSIPTPSCCYRRCRIRAYRRTLPLLRTGESHRESSIRLPAAASDGAARLLSTYVLRQHHRFAR